MIIMNNENNALKWATKMYYEDENRSSHYNKLAKSILDDDRLSLAKQQLIEVKRSSVEVTDSSVLHNWCSNMRGKIKCGVWFDDRNYVSSKMYGAHYGFIQNLGYPVFIE